MSIHTQEQASEVASVPLLRRLIAIGTLTLVAAFPVGAESLQLVMPIAVGGAMDTVGRALGEAVGQRLGEPVVPINKPGAGGRIGADFVGNQPTLKALLMAGPAFNSQQLIRSNPFDPKRLTPISLVGVQPYILFIRTGIPATTVAEFIEWARKQPHGVTFATSGPGSGPHIAAAQFADVTNVKPVFIPTSGQAAFIPLVISGEVDAVFSGPNNRQLVEKGRLRALFAAAEKPITEWPEMPTSDQVGLKGLRLATWYGMFANIHTPAAELERYSRIINDVLGDPAMMSKLRKVGVIPSPSGSPQNFTKFLTEEYNMMQSLVKKKLLELE
jgi:tripartite-type tricarboxylate transporter receptor subunit TctC